MRHALKQIPHSFFYHFSPQAIECLLGAAELNPRDAQVYSKLGLNYGKSGKLDSAMQAFDTALALDPTHAMARSNKAVALERMGKQEVILFTCVSIYYSGASNAFDALLFANRRMQPLLGKR
jgi:lipoprotein NlpI